jgi:hypothetical protein
MSDASRFRNRASECRALSKSARTKADVEMLESIAFELDLEADKIDAETARKPLL